MTGKELLKNRHMRCFGFLVWRHRWHHKSRFDCNWFGRLSAWKCNNAMQGFCQALYIPRKMEPYATIFRSNLETKPTWFPAKSRCWNIGKAMYRTAAVPWLFAFASSSFWCHFVSSRFSLWMWWWDLMSKAPWPSTSKPNMLWNRPSCQKLPMNLHNYHWRVHFGDCLGTRTPIWNGLCFQVPASAEAPRSDMLWLRNELFFTILILYCLYFNIVNFFKSIYLQTKAIVHPTRSWPGFVS